MIRLANEHIQNIDSFQFYLELRDQQASPPNFNEPRNSPGTGSKYNAAETSGK